MRRIVTKGRNKLSPQGFTLLEIALAMAILGVVAIYTLDMYQATSSRKRQVDDRRKMAEIATAFKAYYSGHEGLPPAGDSFPDSIPVADLGLGQSYRFDTHGRPYLYFPAASASGAQVDGRPAAGVLISLGENQLQDYTVAVSNFTTSGDDTLYPIEVNAEAVAIALAELESLGKRVEAYNREFAGVQEDPGRSYYGDTAAGAPPIIDPDDYDGQYAAWPQLYPYNPYYPTFTDIGPPPTDADLAYDQPDNNWPDPPIYNNWPSRPPDPPTDLDLPPGFVGWSGPGPFVTWPFAANVFGEYNPDPIEPVEAPESYELIDEGGCMVSSDPNCVFVTLDTSGNPLQDIVARYGLGSSLQTDPWGNAYQWGGGLTNADPRYHLFFSAGPDGTSGTDDDIILY